MALAPLREAADSLAKASTPQPFSKSKTSNWVAKRGGLPDYIQHVAHGILRSNPSLGESGAIQRAIGVVKNWAAGGKNVDAGTRAAAAKAVAEWERMKGSQVAHSAGGSPVGGLADHIAVRDDALTRLALIEQQMGVDGMIATLAFGAQLEEAAPAAMWAPTLKRTASSRDELERHEVHDGGQHVGTIGRRQGYGRNEPDRFVAHAVNGDRITDYSGGTREKAIDAIKKHLEEAPARVAQHSNGKWLVARPASYSGPDTYAAYPSQSSARFAAGLPDQPTVPEQNSKVQALGEMLRWDLMTVSGIDIPPLRRVQEARRKIPFELAESFSAAELRDFRGRWSPGGGHHIGPSSLAPRSAPRATASVAAQRYEGGVPRASARARAAHAAKPQIAEKALGRSIGRGSWSPGARRATRALSAQRVASGDELVAGVKAGKLKDTETIHRKRNTDGSLGAYSAERKALHEQILSNLLQGKGSHPGTARAIFTAGGPASGKSGLIKSDGARGFEKKVAAGSPVSLPADAVTINPDLIKEMLPEYQALKAAGRDDASSLVHEEASHLAKVLMRTAVARQHHVVVDTVGDSGPGKFKAKIEAAQRAGHHVSVHYANTSVETALERSHQRFLKTGRAVPEDTLRAAHAAVSKTFAADIQHMRGVHLQVFDTTSGVHLVSERKPKDDKLRIVDAAKHAAFLRKGGG